MVCLLGSAMLIVSTTLMSGYGLSLRLVLESLGTRDGEIPQGCQLSMTFIVALYLELKIPVNGTGVLLVVIAGIL